MKRILILFYCVLSAIFAMSQELTVKSFKEKTSDLAASTHERKDGNGNSCALVKVQLATVGAQFSPNIVGNVEYKVNEYWVYLPTISKHLMVKHPNFLTKDIVFADYNVKLEGKTTYELVLAMPETGNTPQIVTSQYLVFTVNPQDAIVEVNGEIWPNTSGIARKFVPFGDYTYSIQSKDYHSVSSSVSVNDPNNKVVVDVKLKPAFGTISVPANGDLSGAIVYIDNKMAGKVPLTADKISSGTHDIRIAKSMYKSFEQTVTVNDGETTTVAPELTANFSTITFNVDNNAEIWINDEKKGIGTWTGNLESGNYRVETRKTSHRSQSKEYSIQSSTGEQTIKLNAPTPIYGSLNIMAMPDGADIYIDGSKVGETPMFLQQVLIGQHEIKISKSGYSSLRQKINIEEANTTVVNNQLAKAQTTNGGSPNLTVAAEELKAFYESSRPIKNEINLSSAGELSEKINKLQAPVTELSISGEMDARDFNFIKSYCKSLSRLDLSQVRIVSYNGSGGTNSAGVYRADEIPVGAFFYWAPVDDGMHSLTEVKLPQNITKIRRNAFARAYNLVKIIIPEGVTTIELVAFAVCTSLKSVELPSSLKEVGMLAFNDCEKLSTVYIHAVTPPTIANNAFGNIAKGAVLYVPCGCESAYRNSVWSKFFSVRTIGENTTLPSQANSNNSANAKIVETVATETTRANVDNSRTINGHRFVDLGLSSGKLWAETNIGASKSADDGNYYAWGETKPKANYTWGTYKHGNGSLQYKYSVLRKEDDAAFVNWGEPCHIPTREDFEELRKNCSWTWTNQKTSSGKMMNGYLVESKKNRNSIFLPASSSRYENKKDTRLYGDLGYYWSASPNVFLGIDEFDNETLSEKDPCEGFTVRPIAEIGTTTTKVVETFPKFPYGNPQEWIINHFNIPEACIAANAQGKEVVSFVVQEDGSIGEITILESVHPSVDDAIKQILAKMPKWTPGTQDGKPVRVSYKAPMNIYYH